MKNTNQTIEWLKEKLYTPLGLKVEDLIEEKQNHKYKGYQFRINERIVRFRVAHLTPKKMGQFVAFWEKDSSGVNQPYFEDTASELLIITCFHTEEVWGQFVFPKKILKEKGVLRSNSADGKMAMRLYPSWDHPTSRVARESQAWQLDYFFIYRQVENEDILRLYAQ